MFKIAHNKKGDMTLNIIIGAAIAMVVMVVMILIFTGKINIFANSECGGMVVLPGDCGAPDGPNNEFQVKPQCIIPGTFKDVKSGQVCCSVNDPCDPQNEIRDQ